MLKEFKGWENKTVADVFAETVARHPDKNAILFEDQRWTFRQLDHYANKIANFFLEQGMKKDDTVAMFMENCPEYIGVWLGLSKIGVRGSFINYNLRDSALLHCLRICQPKAIIYSTSLGEALKTVHGELGQAIQDSIFSIGGKDTCLLKSQVLDEELIGMSSCCPPRPKDASSRGESALYASAVTSSWGVSSLCALDCLCYIYTSGTTGLPKAVPLRNIRYTLTH